MSVLAIVGFGMITIFMILLMTKRITAMNGLILIPIAVALALGFGPKVGAMALDGIKKVAPTAVMIAFAMVYFMIMIDTGLFDPLINAILKAAKGDPIRVIVGTALLAGLVSLFLGLVLLTDVVPASLAGVAFLLGCDLLVGGIVVVRTAGR